jgi:hypothetical protein
MHPCERIYLIGANGIIYGNEPGICRITGKQSTGILFKNWVRDTFTDHSYLLPGNIISNEALFCFDESSELLMKLTGREKPQRFRTYSHIVSDGKWHIFTKADKATVYDLIVSGNCELVCLAESGQKHILFKHKNRMWQVEEMQIMPDIPLLQILHENMQNLLNIGFSQAEIITGNYIGYRIMKAGIPAWAAYEENLKPHRKTQIFNFSTWMMHAPKLV